MNESGDDKERPSIQLDAYGIRLHGALGDVESPLTWRDVVRRMNRALMTIAAAPLELTADALNLARRLLHFGAGHAPTAGRVVERAHDVAETRELQQQDRQSVGSLPAEEPGDSLTEQAVIARLHAFLEAKRRDGVVADVRFVGKTAVVSLHRAECETTHVVMLADAFLKSLDDMSRSTSVEDD